MSDVTVTAYEVDHPSGAPPFALRLEIAGQVIAYTGDTSWTDTLIEVAAGANLLIAEAYYRAKNIPFHLGHADLLAHQGELAADRIILTHMSDDMLGHDADLAFEGAYDGLVINLGSEQ